jgi:hypothetical protein
VGYRLYDDDSLDRLTFIARAKQVGCSLDEITDLVAIWAGRRCGPVQRRLHELVTTKIGAAEIQVDALSTFIAQLRSAADQLRRDPVDGPCGPDCACLRVDGGSAEATTAAVVPSRPTTHASAPIACTLQPRAMPDRLAEWAVVVESATRRTRIDGGLRIDLRGDIDLGDLGLLIGAEQRCCAFLSFALGVDADGIALEVRAPDRAADVITSVFGPAP